MTYTNSERVKQESSTFLTSTGRAAFRTLSLLVALMAFSMPTVSHGQDQQGEPVVTLGFANPNNQSRLFGPSTITVQSVEGQSDALAAAMGSAQLTNALSNSLGSKISITGPNWDGSFTIQSNAPIAIDGVSVTDTNAAAAVEALVEEIFNARGIEISDTSATYRALPQTETSSKATSVLAAGGGPDPELDALWGTHGSNVSSTNASDVWAMTRGEGTVVAVLDTGVTAHSDLGANIVPGADFVAIELYPSGDGDGVDPDPSDPGDYTVNDQCYSGWRGGNSSWHGTHVTGTIGAIQNGNGIAGVAPGSKVMPVRVLTACGGSPQDIANGILWAAGLFSRAGIPDPTQPADVINLSLGGFSSGGCPSTYQSAIDEVNRRTASLIVVAAGNSKADVSLYTPANCNDVLTIAAVERTGGLAEYSNKGLQVDLAAPGGAVYLGSGEGILSTLNTGLKSPVAESYREYQGTSMAAPHASGAAALLYAFHRKYVSPTVTQSDRELIKKALKDSAKAFQTAVARPCTQFSCGWGYLNGADAVRFYAAARGVAVTF